MSFINDLAPAAQKVAAKYNILPSLILAQAYLESAGGTSGLAVQGKNLFGVKGKYEGQSVNMLTTEYQNGQAYHTNATFKKYPSWAESMEDLALLYCNGVSWDRNKYHSIIGEKNYEEACKKVQAAGYATDPHYAEKLIQVIVRYGLAQYDPKPTPNVAPAGPSKRTAIVKKGDTLSKILRTNDKAKIQAVCKANGIKDPNLIYPGQKIIY